MVIDSFGRWVTDCEMLARMTMSISLRRQSRQPASNNLSQRKNLTITTAEWSIFISSVTKVFRFMTMSISSLSVDMSSGTRCVPDWCSGPNIGGGVHCGDGFASPTPARRCYRRGQCLDFLAGPGASTLRFRNQSWLRCGSPPNAANRRATKPGAIRLPVVSTWNQPCAREVESEFASQKPTSKRPDPLDESATDGLGDGVP